MLRSSGRFVDLRVRSLSHQPCTYESCLVKVVPKPVPPSPASLGMSFPDGLFFTFPEDGTKAREKEHSNYILVFIK